MGAAPSQLGGPTTSNSTAGLRPTSDLSVAPPLKPKSLSLDLEKPPSDRAASPMTPSEGAATGVLTHMKSIRRFGRAGSIAAMAETKVLVVWLESYEDLAHFPTGG